MPPMKDKMIAELTADVQRLRQRCDALEEERSSLRRCNALEEDRSSLRTCSPARWLAWAVAQFPCMAKAPALADHNEPRDAFDALDAWGVTQSRVTQALVRVLLGFWSDPQQVTAPGDAGALGWRCRCPDPTIAGLWGRMDRGNQAALLLVLQHARWF